MTFFYSASNCWQLPPALKTNSCTNPGAGLFAVHSLPARRSRRFVDALSKQTATKNTGSRQGPSVGSERFRWSWITYTLQPVANTLTPYNIIPCQPRCALRKRTDDVCLVFKKKKKQLGNLINNMTSNSRFLFVEFELFKVTVKKNPSGWCRCVRY